MACISIVDNIPKIPSGDYHLNTKRAAAAAVTVAAVGVYRKADDKMFLNDIFGNRWYIKKTNAAFYSQTIVVQRENAFIF